MSRISAADRPSGRNRRRVNSVMERRPGPATETAPTSSVAIQLRLMQQAQDEVLAGEEASEP